MSEDIAAEESMPVHGSFKEDNDAVFVEYDPKIAMEKLLTLSQNQNSLERYIFHNFRESTE